MNQQDMMPVDVRVHELETELASLRQERVLIGKISDTLDLGKLLDLLGHEIDAVGDFDGYMVNLVDKSHENLVCEKVKLPDDYSGMETTYQKYKFPLDLLDANVEAYGQRRVVYVDQDNVALFEGDTRLRFERWFLQSLVVIPILGENIAEEPLGTIMLYRRQGPVSPAWVAVIEQYLVLFRRQIKLAFLCKEVQQQERAVQLVSDEQQRFFQFVSKINTLNSSRQIFDTISLEFLRRFPFDLFAILIREGDLLIPRKFKVINEKYQGECTALESFFQDKSYSLAVGGGASVTCFQQNQPLVIPDALKVLHLPMSQNDAQSFKLLKSPRTLVFVPVRQADTPVGLIWLVSLGRPVHFSDAQLKLVELLGSFIGTALSNANLFTLVQNQKEKIEELNRALELKVRQLHDLSSQSHAQ